MVRAQRFLYWDILPSFVLFGHHMPGGDGTEVPGSSAASAMMKVPVIVITSVTSPNPSSGDEGWCKPPCSQTGHY